MSEEKDRKSSQDSATELTDEEAEKVAGGVIAIQPPPIGDSQIVSPRDAASGLPTGKRMHKPF
jgi:hypothetical protein